MLTKIDLYYSCLHFLIFTNIFVSNFLFKVQFLLSAFLKMIILLTFLKTQDLMIKYFFEIILSFNFEFDISLIFE